METLKNDTVNNFIIEQTLITPIKKIITQLNNGNFRDCDLIWIENKLSAFMSFAAETIGLNKNIIQESESVKPKFMNDYAKEYYLKYFNQLLNYFIELSN